MNEDQYLASLKLLNSKNVEEFYLNSLSPTGKLTFQAKLFGLLVRDYSPWMVIYAFAVIIAANIKALFIPRKTAFVPGTMMQKFPVKTWYQGERSNSSVVAVIKAVQARYNNDIFKSCFKGFDGSYDVILRDGEKLKVTKEELDLATAAADFQGMPTKSKNDAYLAFAVMVKNAVKREEFGNFHGALGYFESGSFPEYCAELLGYIHCTMITDPMRGLGDIIVAYSKSHAVCVNHGFIEGYSERLVFAGHDATGDLLNNAIIIV